MCNEMDTKFERMGARVKVTTGGVAGFVLNVRRDKAGEYFDLRCSRETRVNVLDLRSRDG